MHNSMDKFSAAAYGNGRLLGIFSTEFLKHFVNATLYDRSDQFQPFVKQEIQLGKSKFASPEFRRSALKTERNQAAPPPVDISITVRCHGELETATVAGKGMRRVFSFRFNDKTKSYDDVVKLVKSIIASV
jgi:hypothetical protein